MIDWKSRYQEEKLRLQQQQEEWRWTNYWLGVWSLITASTAFLVGMAIGFVMPA
jgi:hypothetical protein